MFRVRSLAENPSPAKTMAGGFATELTTRSGLARTPPPGAENAAAEAPRETISATASTWKRMATGFPEPAEPKRPRNLGFFGLGLGLGGRLARRFRGRRLVGRLLLGLRLGDGGLGRGLCRGTGLLGLGCCRSFFLSCDLIERLQLFLGRQFAAFGHDREAKRRRHIGEELDRNFVASDPLDRLGEVELTPVDPDPLALPDPVGDVRRRHRAEEGAGLTGLDVEAELGALELLHELLRLLEALRLVLGAARGELLELHHPARCGGL